MKNLKKYIKAAVGIIAAASLGISATSCDDLLDTKPQGAFTTEQIGDEEAIDLMTAAYATLMCHYFGNNESFAGPINNWVFDVRADDAYKGGDGVTMEAYMHQLEVGNVQSDNPIGDFKWRNNYYSISRCNTAIRALAAAGNLDDKARQSYIAEMKTLRAYYYFDMYRIFKMFPYFDETVTDPSSCRADEYTRDQIAGFIRQDLRDSYEVLPEFQEQVGRFTKYVAAATPRPRRPLRPRLCRSRAICRLCHRQRPLQPLPQLPRHVEARVQQQLRSCARRTVPRRPTTARSITSTTVSTAPGAKATSTATATTSISHRRILSNVLPH